MIKKFEEREVITKTGRIVYVVQSLVNFVVDEQQEYVVNLFSDLPNIQPGEYEVPLNNLNLRVKQPKTIPGIPGVPGIPNPNNAKKL